MKSERALFVPVRVPAASPPRKTRPSEPDAQSLSPARQLESRNFSAEEEEEEEELDDDDDERRRFFLRSFFSPSPLSLPASLSLSLCSFLCFFCFRPTQLLRSAVEAHARQAQPVRRPAARREQRRALLFFSFLSFLSLSRLRFLLLSLS